MAYQQPSPAERDLFERATHVKIRPGSSTEKPFKHFAVPGQIYRIGEAFPFDYEGTGIRLGKPEDSYLRKGTGQTVHFSHLIPLVRTEGKFVELSLDPRDVSIPADLATALNEWRRIWGRNARNPDTKVGCLLIAADKYLPPTRPEHAIRADLVPGAVFEIAFQPDNTDNEDDIARGLYMGTRVVIAQDDGTNYPYFKRYDGGLMGGEERRCLSLGRLKRVVPPAGTTPL